MTFYTTMAMAKPSMNVNCQNFILENYVKLSFQKNFPEDYPIVTRHQKGMVIKNYRMEGEGFLVTLLKEYFAENENLDLDTELNGIQLNIF